MLSVIEPILKNCTFGNLTFAGLINTTEIYAM